MARSNGLRSAAALAIVLAFAALASRPASAQTESETPVALKGKLERIKVHGRSLEGNLMGESAEPEVSIYLPPSYATDRNRRYPVVYLLHGYTGTDLGYFGPTGRQLHVIAERVFGSRRGERDDPGDAELHERVRRLHVLELGHGRRLGGLRRRRPGRVHGQDTTARSPTRDEPRPRRPLDGRLRHAAHRDEAARRVRAMYALSSCCLNEGTVRPPRDGARRAGRDREDRSTKRGATAAARRARSRAPPRGRRTRRTRRSIWTCRRRTAKCSRTWPCKWAANSPVAMLDQYVPNLKKYNAIALDIGLQDTLITSNKVFVEALKRFGIAAHVRDLRRRSRQPHPAAARGEGAAVLLEATCRSSNRASGSNEANLAEARR